MKNKAFKRIVSLFMALCLIATALVSVVFAKDVAEPVFSIEGGIYENEITVTIDGGGNKVYYTTDGSDPNIFSTEYSGSITVSENNHSPRSVQGTVAQSRMAEGTVIKAICVDDMGNASSIVTNTYFVSREMKEMAEKVPVVALSLKPDDLWDRREGIYTNYDYEHNVPAYVEYFDTNGEGFERGIEMKVSGHGSRYNAKKSLRLYFTKGDTSNGKNIEYNLIEGTDKNFYDSRPVKKYGKVTYRISDWTDTDLKDVVAQKITEYMRPESANSKPAAVYLNGEFWGIYEQREQYDNRYVDYHYEGIDKDDVIFLDRDWTNETVKSTLSDTGEVYTDRVSYEEGPEEDEELYRDLFGYTRYLMTNADKDDNYGELAAYIDIDNFIDYLFVYLYCDNIDWPGNNYKFWRTSIERTNGDVYGADGKWRFMVHDFDLAFDNARNNTFEYAIKSNLDDSEPRHPGFAARSIDGMMKVEKFRDEFAQRAAAYLATAVSEENIGEITEKLIEERKGVKSYDLMRWNLMRGTSGQRLEEWERRVRDKFNGFAKARNEVLPDMIKEFYKKYYGSEIGDPVDFTFTTDAERGSVIVSGAVIRKSLYGDMAASFSTKQFANIPLEIAAEPVEGYKVSSIVVKTSSGTTTYDSESVVITPQAGERYEVSVNFAEGTSATTRSGEFFVLRKERFSKMKVGEKLPIDVAYSDGEKIFDFEASVIGSAADITGGVLTAKEIGEARLVVSENGSSKEVKIVVTE